MAKFDQFGCGGIIILMDADEDCPAELGPAILRKASAIATPVPVAVTLANWEFESWFIASYMSLANQGILKGGQEVPLDIEAVRAAKAWISRAMVNPRGYRETLHQMDLARKFNLDEARTNSRSFRKFHKDITMLIEALC